MNQLRDGWQNEFRETQGIRLHCVTAGGEGNPLVLLLHGYPEYWFSWSEQIDPLVAAGYRVLVPDLRGYGTSDRPKSGYDLLTLSEDIAGLIVAEKRESAIVVGHDWGGSIAWELAARQGHRVEKLVVLNAPHPQAFLETVRTSLDQMWRSRYMLFYQLPWIPEWVLGKKGALGIARVLQAWSKDRGTFSEELLAEYRAVASEAGAISAMLAYYRVNLRKFLSPGALRKSLQGYSVITCPTLLVWAEEDPALGVALLPAHESKATNLRIERIPGCGHFVQRERASDVNALLLSFLGGPAQ